MLISVLFALLFLSRVSPAQAPRALQVRDLFALDYFVQYPREEPKGWIDARHYAVFEPEKGWFAVEAASGEREVLLPRKALEARLVQMLGKPADVAKALSDPDLCAFGPRHQKAVWSVGKDLFLVSRDGSASRLTNTPSEELEVHFSPDGTRVAFVAEGDLHVVACEGGEVRRLTEGGGKDLLHGRLDWVYQEEIYGRGDFRGFWWSPDGKRIALLELDERPVKEFTIVASEPARPAVEVAHYPKAGEDNPIARLGVVDVGDGALRWFDLSAWPDGDRLISRVTWTEDSKEVFFQVQNRAQTFLDMMAGDASSGALRRVFHETSDCWVEPGPEPVWLDGGDFLWLSERDGYRHIYRYSRTGAEKGRLTQGDWQVLDIVAVDRESRTVWFRADKESPLTAHLYSVPLDGGEIRAITKGRGTHEIDMAEDHATFLSDWSSAEVPHRTVLYDRDGNEIREVASSDLGLLGSFRLPRPRFLKVPLEDGFEMEAVLIEPPGFEDGKRYPVVQFTYSGPHTPRVRDRWGGRDYLWYSMLAQKGYVVFGCDNRSASGKGRKFAKVCWKNLGSTELADLEAGARWLVGRGIADPERIAIWGWSYGGYQTCFNLTHSRTWKVGIAVNPVTDWLNYDTIYTERYMGLPTDNPSGYRASSVVAAAANLHGQLMLVASAMDDNVHMQNSLQLLKALQQNQKDCDFMVYPGVRHGIEDLMQQMHLFARMTSFLERNL